jgi:hypothetical protein
VCGQSVSELFLARQAGTTSYVNNVKRLVDGGLGVERESGIDLGGDLARNDLEDLLAELDEQVVESPVDLLLQIPALALGLGNGGVQKLGILGLLGGGKDKGGVGGGILGLVLANGCDTVSMFCVVAKKALRGKQGVCALLTGKVTGIADNDLSIARRCQSEVHSNR